MSWNLIFDEHLQGNDTPIPAISLSGLSGRELLVIGSSATAKPTWWLAFRLEVKMVIFESPIGSINSQVLYQKIPLSTPIAIRIPPLAASYDLVLDIPDWIANLDIKIWENSIPVLRSIQKWESISNSTQMQNGTAYLVSSDAFMNLTLPADSEIGQQVGVYGSGTATWRIAQNWEQQIQIGDKRSSVGIQGKAEALEPGNLLFLEYAGNGLWMANQILGNFELT